MAYYKLLLTIITISVGFTTITLLVKKTKSSNSRTFEYMSSLILFFNLWLILSLIFEYFNLHISPGMEKLSRITVTFTYLLVSRIFQLFILFYAISLVTETFPNSRFVVKKKPLQISIASFAAILVASFLLFLTTHKTAILNYAIEMSALAVLWGSLFYIIVLLINTLELKEREKKISILVIGISWGIFLSVITFLTMASYFGYNLWFIYIPTEITLDFLISLAFLVWVWKYSSALADSRITPVSADIKKSIDQISEEFSITEREKEIIKLICSGNSNQEIADQLFISLRTVKAHIYNIFQKTGVKSRIQLANIFTSDSQ